MNTLPQDMVDMNLCFFSSQNGCLVQNAMESLIWETSLMYRLAFMKAPNLDGLIPGPPPLWTMSSPISSSQSQTITNIAFGIIATVIGVFTLWQGHRAWKMWREHESQPVPLGLEPR